ncbi:P-loop containing nucleoside triphosphate hydrolase protein [Tuber brumale]|nr:P-loop containing nucleoside triphosphate hydrolase protein [Tuber brumale]
MPLTAESDIEVSYRSEDGVEALDEASTQLLAALNPASGGRVKRKFSIDLPTLESLGLSRDEYQSFPEEMLIKKIKKEVEIKGVIHCKAVFADGSSVMMPYTQLAHYGNWGEAYADFVNQDGTLPGATSSEEIVSGRDTSASSLRGRQGSGKATTPRNVGSFSRSGQRVELNSPGQVSQGDNNSPAPVAGGRQLRKRNLSLLAKQRKSMREAEGIESSEDEDANKAIGSRNPTKGGGRRTRSTGISRVQMLPYGYDDDDELIVSDLMPPPGRRRRGLVSLKRRNATEAGYGSSDYGNDNPPERRSGRTTGRKNMYREPDPNADDDFMDIDTVAKPKKPQVVRAKEVFPSLDKHGDFARFHDRTCDTCLDRGTSKSRGILVYCQGCSYTYHQLCLGHRATREHLVTRVAGENHVLQCKRCIGRARLKRSTAPCLDKCTACRITGESCQPFSDLRNKSTQKKDASTNASAETSDVEVDPERLYNPENVLFRCRGCRRAWHFNHLPATAESVGKPSAKNRLEEYSREWKCDLCQEHREKATIILAWRPSDKQARQMKPELIDYTDFAEDEREYLVKFAKQSYFHCIWLPGAWVSGAFPLLHTGFMKRGPKLCMTTEEAVPEEWLRIEICLDVEYDSYVPVGNDAELDLLRITDVTKAYVKFRGLGYEEAVWEQPPKESEEERWEEWKQAYGDYIHGFYVRSTRGILDRIKKARSLNFDQKLVKKMQPEYVKGGTLMDYQMEGLNWLYYKWWKGQNAVLADEMGLGKTIQVISFLSVLLEDHNVWPFLIVVPNSTVPNWKREIQRWLPNMRVVAYPSVDTARKLSKKYEMFHPGTTELKCHVVVTSYNSPVSDAKTLRPIRWQALIVDEGQRLKNDRSQFYTEMAKYHTGFKLLMTGTPLQNNPRELFNLLQFLDPKVQAAEMEEEFGELTKENVPTLHAMIRPYFLRRTKGMVLDLPPMTEIIVPVSMTNVQRKLYKSILTKDTALIKSILAKHGKGKLKLTERTKLNNLLMQLRKCLCHPFLYNEDIEEQDVDPETAHKNLVDAGSKLELLSLLLPKLKERGHRVLMFTQFLGMLDILEDFLFALDLKYQRLDGGVSTLERQKRIDSFNAPDSKYFAFMLSTRAGGVGINLATADTVIILDPDFNPHQDIQALSRAHRIGQTKRVQVFHLVTRDTAEEKIIQIGKKKLSLDHLIIEKMDATEEEEVDVESILKFGARALFEDEGEASEARRIRYDDDSVDKLLERVATEEPTVAEKDGANTGETAFSFARVWANDTSVLEEGFGQEQEEEAPLGFWDKVLKEREEEARLEAASKAEELGRGRRNKKVDYRMGLDFSSKRGPGATSDTDFHDSSGPESDSEEERAGSEVSDKPINANHTQNLGPQTTPIIPQTPMEFALPDSNHLAVPRPPPPYVPPPSRHIPIAQPPYLPYPPSAPFNSAPIGNLHPLQSTQHVFGAPPAPAMPRSSMAQMIPAAPVAPIAPMVLPPLHVFHTAPGPAAMPHPDLNGKCLACGNPHSPGQCPLRYIPVQHCQLCSTAHLPGINTCPHLSSETQVNEMLMAVNLSPEIPALTADAKQLLRERKGEIKLKKKEVARRRQASMNNAPSANGY